MDLIAQKIFRQIKDPEHPLHDLLPSDKVSNGSVGYISISGSIGQNCAKLCFQEILRLVNDKFTCFCLFIIE